MVQKKANPGAAVTGPEDDEAMVQQQQLGRFWQVVDRIRERNADKDPDEVLRDVTAAVAEVRQERYERAQREAASRR